MNYSAMSDELQKIALGPARIIKGVYKGLLGRGVPATQAASQARGIGFFAKTKQKPRALKALKFTREITPKLKKVAEEKVALGPLGLFLAGTAAKAIAKRAPKLLAKGMQKGLLKGPQAAKALRATISPRGKQVRQIAQRVGTGAQVVGGFGVGIGGSSAQPS